jgi:hypothetical protein
MVMPGTVGDRWFIGVSEIASCNVLSWFIYLVVFTALAKYPLLPKKELTSKRVNIFIINKERNR